MPRPDNYYVRTDVEKAEPEGLAIIWRFSYARDGEFRYPVCIIPWDNKDRSDVFALVGAICYLSDMRSEQLSAAWTHPFGSLEQLQELFKEIEIDARGLIEQSSEPADQAPSGIEGSDDSRT